MDACPHVDVQKMLEAVSSMLMFVFYAIYIRGIFKGYVHPVIMTWIIWFGLDVIMSYGMWLNETWNWQMRTSASCCAIVFVLSFFYGKWSWTRWDVVCFCCAVVAAFFAASQNTTYSVIAAAVGMFVGTVPTLISTWSNPSDESPLAWIIGLTSNICSVLAVKKWTIVSGTQPLEFLVGALLVVGIMLYRSKTA